MLNWDDVQKTIKSFMKTEVLGSGYVDEYYDSFAYTLTQYLKVLETADVPPSQPRVDETELRQLLALRDAIKNAVG